MKNQSLANRTLVIDSDNNIKTEDFLRQIPTVVDVIWIDQSSSSGDWFGVVVERVNEKYQICEFWQEIDYENKTGKTIQFENAIFQSTVPFEEEEVMESLNERYRDYDCYDNQKYEFEEEKLKTIKKTKYEQQQIDFG